MLFLKQSDYSSKNTRVLRLPRQIGTDASRSDYIAYVDADDRWPHDKLQKLQAISGDQDIHFLFADLQRAVPGAGKEDYQRMRITGAAVLVVFDDTVIIVNGVRAMVLRTTYGL